MNAQASDADGATIMGATVRLTNAQASDLLSIAGALPAGITSSVDDSVAGVITLYLSGPASFASMQAAIGAVRFSNTSENPVGGNRIINVSVSDGELDSPLATATITVNPVDNVAVLGADTIITNLPLGTSLIVPEWAFLANDVDVDTILDITAVSASAGLSGLSLATNPGSITFSDLSPANGSFTYTANGVNANVTVTSQASTQTSNVRDQFGVTSYAINNGSVNWAGSWAETGDDNSASSANGQIRVNSSVGVQALEFDAGNNAAASNGASIRRTVELTGASNPVLTYTFQELGLDAGETVTVEFSDDGSFSAGHVQLIQTITSTTHANNTTISTMTAALTGSFTAAATLRFTASAMNLDADSVRIDNVNIAFAKPLAFTGSNGSEIMIGDGTASLFNALGGNDTIFAGGGNDVINAGSGDDTIAQLSTEGRNLVDGGADHDTFQINGDATAETFTIYTRQAWLDAGGGNSAGQIAATTEIVITRNGSSNAFIVAELDNIEEIVVNTLNATANNGNGVVDGGSSAGDTIVVVGDFSAPTTSLDYSTITVNGSGATDTVDITGLTSDHRIVFNGGGGGDNFIGNLRPQDVVTSNAGNAQAVQKVSVAEVAPQGANQSGAEASWFDASWLSFAFGAGLGNFKLPFDFGDFGMPGFRFNGGFESIQTATTANLKPDRGIQKAFAAPADESRLDGEMLDLAHDLWGQNFGARWQAIEGHSVF